MFDDYRAIGSIQAITDGYMKTSQQHMQIEACAKRLSHAETRPTNISGLGPESGGTRELPYKQVQESYSIGEGHRKASDAGVNDEQTTESTKSLDDKESLAARVRAAQSPTDWKGGSELIDGICNLILQDSDLLALLATATENIGKERMAKNLYILLQDLSVNLLQIEQMRTMVGFVSEQVFPSGLSKHMLIYRR
jgi:hypothetical protein